MYGVYLNFESSFKTAGEKSTERSNDRTEETHTQWMKHEGKNSYRFSQMQLKKNIH